MELIKSQVISISYVRVDRYALHYNLDIISLHCRGALALAKRAAEHHGKQHLVNYPSEKIWL